MPDEHQFAVKKWSAVIPMSKEMFIDGIYDMAWVVSAATEAKASWSWEQLHAERQRLQDLLHAQLLTRRFKNPYHG